MSLQESMARLEKSLEDVRKGQKELKRSLTLQALRPDIFKHGPTRVGGTMSFDSKTNGLALYEVYAIDGNKHRHYLSRFEAEALAPHLSRPIHSEYRETP